MFGNTEIQYLKSLSLRKRRSSLEKLMEFKIPCIIISNKNKPFDELLEFANSKDFQIWIERVDESGKVGIMIEDGMIK